MGSIRAVCVALALVLVSCNSLLKRPSGQTSARQAPRPSQPHQVKEGHRHARGCGHIYQGGQWISDGSAPKQTPRDPALRSLVESIELVRQAIHTVSSTEHKYAPLRQQSEAERILSLALNRFPKNPYAFYFLGILHLNWKEKEREPRHHALMAFSFLNSARTFRTAVSKEQIDAYLKYKYPSTYPLGTQYSARTRRQLRERDWPFDKAIETVERDLARATGVAVQYFIGGLPSLGHAVLSSSMDSGDRPNADLSRSIRDAGFKPVQGGHYIQVQRADGWDLLRLSASPLQGNHVMKTRFSIWISYEPGDDSKARDLLETEKLRAEEETKRLQQELDRTLASHKKVRDDQWARMVGVHEAEAKKYSSALNRHRNTLATLDEGVKSAQEVLNGAKKTESTVVVARFEEGLRKIRAVYDANAPDLRAAITKCEAGYRDVQGPLRDGMRTFAAGPEKKYKAAVSEATAKAQARNQSIRNTLVRHEKEVYAPARRAHQEAGTSYWPKLRQKLEARIAGKRAWQAEYTFLTIEQWSEAWEEIRSARTDAEKVALLSKLEGRELRFMGSVTSVERRRQGESWVNWQSVDQIPKPGGGYWNGGELRGRTAMKAKDAARFRRTDRVTVWVPIVRKIGFLDTHKSRIKIR